jgi:hypothetical protein
MAMAAARIACRLRAASARSGLAAMSIPCRSGPQVRIPVPGMVRTAWRGSSRSERPVMNWHAAWCEVSYQAIGHIRSTRTRACHSRAI